jgi:outer membrane protein assembly factor BamB
VLRIGESNDAVVSGRHLTRPLLPAADARRLWIAGATLATIDVRTEKDSVVFDPHLKSDRRQIVDPSAGDIAVDGTDGVVLFDGRAVIRLDRATGEQRRSAPLAPFADIGRIAVAGGSVWVTSSSTNNVRQLDAERLTPIRTIRVGTTWSGSRSSRVGPSEPGPAARTA